MDTQTLIYYECQRFIEIIEKFSYKRGKEKYYHKITILSFCQKNLIE